MGDMFENSSTCSSSSSTHFPSSSSRVGASDEISLLLHQILLRSSSSSASEPFSSSPSITGLCNSSGLPDILHRPFRSPLVRDGISAVESSDGVNSTPGVVLSSSGACFSAHVCSSSVAVSENEADEYDCESEEGLEALFEEAPAKSVPSRSSSKRSRAAEVHNLSEKRRRSRINEKMKALQNLIPNSNKTDKASMLDEAIEYLKQLQLQVQMLSMRNGISLHPMCLPGVVQPIQLSQMRIGFGEENGSLHVNMPNTLPVNQETPGQTLFSLTNQCSGPNQPSIPDMSNIINSETSFGLESPIQAHLGPFRLPTSSEEICGQDMLRHQQLSVNHSETHPLEFEMGATTTISLPFNAQASDLKDNRGLEACIIGRDQSEGMLLKNIESDLVLSPHLNGLHTGRSTPIDNVKIERRDS